jgi:hypothetical protein
MRRIDLTAQMAILYQQQNVMNIGCAALKGIRPGREREVAKRGGLTIGTDYRDFSEYRPESNCILPQLHAYRIHLW